MIKRKRAAKVLKRRPRNWLGVACLLFSLAAIVLTSYETDAEGKLTDPVQIFASFADTNLGADQVMRMRNSPLPSTTPQGPWRTIIAVTDGDSMRLDNGTSIRLLGVDAPESSNNRKLREDIYKMGLPVRESDMGKLGLLPGKSTADLCLGKGCWLEYEKSETDDYGRTIAYVHLEDGRIVNEEVLAAGYGKVYLSYPFKYRKRYVLIQASASLDKRGLWGEAFASNDTVNQGGGQP
ncbi:MAG: thermonuclease family protein [Planctomycetaceae bacterium]|nr:thermonuclease family protein [Planctomycetaceae bacterium]